MWFLFLLILSCQPTSKSSDQNNSPFSLASIDALPVGGHSPKIQLQASSQTFSPTLNPELLNTLFPLGDSLDESLGFLQNIVVIANQVFSSTSLSKLLPQAALDALYYAQYVFLANQIFVFLQNNPTVLFYNLTPAQNFTSLFKAGDLAFLKKLREALSIIFLLNKQDPSSREPSSFSEDIQDLLKNLEEYSNSDFLGALKSLFLNSLEDNFPDFFYQPWSSLVFALYFPANNQFTIVSHGLNFAKNNSPLVFKALLPEQELFLRFTSMNFQDPLEDKSNDTWLGRFRKWLNSSAKSPDPRTVYYNFYHFKLPAGLTSLFLVKEENTPSQRNPINSTNAPLSFTDLEPISLVSRSNSSIPKKPIQKKVKK